MELEKAAEFLYLKLITQTDDLIKDHQSKLDRLRLYDPGKTPEEQVKISRQTAEGHLADGGTLDLDSMTKLLTQQDSDLENFTFDVHIAMPLKVLQCCDIIDNLFPNRDYTPRVRDSYKSFFNPSLISAMKSAIVNMIYGEKSPLI